MGHYGGLCSHTSGLTYLGKEGEKDFVGGQDGMRCHPEQEVLQANPAPLHKVRVHVIC